MSHAKKTAISLFLALAVAAAAIGSVIGFGSAELNEDTERAQVGHAVMAEYGE